MVSSTKIQSLKSKQTAYLTREKLEKERQVSCSQPSIRSIYLLQKLYCSKAKSGSLQFWLLLPAQVISAGLYWAMHCNEGGVYDSSTNLEKPCIAKLLETSEFCNSGPDAVNLLCGKWREKKLGLKSYSSASLGQKSWELNWLPSFMQGTVCWVISTHLLGHLNTQDNSI